MIKSLLINREYEVEGSWYAPLRHFRDMDSVVRCNHYDTTSSAGNWSGYVLQKIGKFYYVILFWQINIAWTPYFEVHTDDKPLARLDYEPKEDEIFSMIEDLTMCYAE